ncbi:MAG: N-acetyltransferase [Eubacteriales bacterium]
MLIRQEEERDYNEIKKLIKAAFESAEHTDGNEYNLADSLRMSNGFIKELALVAEEENEIIGHIMFTEVKVGDNIGIALAPLSILPKAQNKGVGTALMKTAHNIAAKMNYGFSVVLGSDKYYPRVGYKTASEYGILAPFDVPNENFMVLFLNENISHIKGTVVYVKEIFEG